ncbi:MAG: HNH endonuclease, partial [Candidatus Korobacteraceae bacterium]
SKAEEEVWIEFKDDWDALAFQSQQLLAQFLQIPPAQLFPEVNVPEGLVRETMVKVRVNQNFFRAAVLAAYNSRCCITGLATPALLTASHIIPWADDDKNRTNPRNGLCLNALHDRAFDYGLLTITPDYLISVSKRLTNSGEAADGLARRLFSYYDGRRITLPDRFIPDPEFLKYHNDHCFRQE